MRDSRSAAGETPAKTRPAIPSTRAAAGHTPLLASLRGLFASVPGWRSAPAGEGRGRRRGEASEHEVAVAADGGLVLLHEVAPGGEFPPHAVRRKLHDRLSAERTVPLAMLVADAGLTRRVWCWRRAATPARPYLELEDPRDAPGRHDLPLRLLRELRRPDPAAALRIDAVLLGRAGAAAHEDGDGVLRWIEGASTPAASRTVWRSLLALQLVDPDCGSGDWLMAAARRLEPLYLAAFSRLDGWSRDAGRETGRPAPDAYVRRLILLHNLFGLAQSRRARAVTRTRLAGWVDGDRSECGDPARHPELRCRVPGPVRLPRTPVEGAGRGPDPRRGELRRAWEIVRELRERGRASEREMVAACGGILARRRQLLGAEGARRGEAPHLLLDPLLRPAPAWALVVRGDG